MTHEIALSEAQLQKLLTTIESLKNGGVHWEQVITVFLSAFLAMVVGICMELFRSSREKKKTAIERTASELRQINVALVGIAYNIEILLHTVFQNILPHYNQSRDAHSALQETSGDGEKIKRFALSLNKYPALMMTCPEMHFVEHDFLDKLPFIVQKDAELVKQAGWLVSLLRTLKSATQDRNKYIEVARNTATQGGLNFYQLDSILQLQKSISEAECVTALQLFDNFLRIASSLEKLSETYTIPGRKKLIPPVPLDDAMNQLRQIAAKITPKMPAA